MSIARTIQTQLGNQTFAMLGASNLIDHGDALSFKFKGSRKANYLKVTLAADDTYSMSFKRITQRGLTVLDVSEVSGIYADRLNAVIESTTGLYTRL